MIDRMKFNPPPRSHPINSLTHLSLSCVCMRCHCMCVRVQDFFSQYLVAPSRTRILLGCTHVRTHHSQCGTVEHDKRRTILCGTRRWGHITHETHNDNRMRIENQSTFISCSSHSFFYLSLSLSLFLIISLFFFILQFSPSSSSSTSLRVVSVTESTWQLELTAQLKIGALSILALSSAIYTVSHACSADNIALHRIIHAHIHRFTHVVFFPLAVTHF